MIDLSKARTELFSRHDFEFITDVGKKRHERQRDALDALTDGSNTEVFFGGAAGGAKSWTGASWIVFSALAYPGTRWFVGRVQLTDLRSSTAVTFSKVFKRYGLREKRDYTYNGQSNYYRFANGSVIEFLQLRYLPTDPMFERFGSKEYTGGWIEEAGEVCEMAFEVLRTRLGRHYNDRYCLPPVMLITANPKKNWLYRRYYQPYLAGVLPAGVTVILSGVDDNPYIESVYKANLEKLTDKVTKDRLLRGIWEYDNNPNALIDKASYPALFSNEAADRSGAHFLTADVARMGGDRSVIMVWRGHTVIEVVEVGRCSLSELSGIIRRLMDKYRIPRHLAIADEDGVGGGVVDFLHIEGFRNGSKPLRGENYANLKTQCAYMTAQGINDGLFGFDFDLGNDKRQMFVAELEQLQNSAPDTDGKLRIKSKEDIRRDLGRSPDWSDAFIMRSFFDLRRVQNDRAHAVENNYPV